MASTTTATTTSLKVGPPMTQSLAYTFYMPIAITVLISLYLCVYFVRCIYWYYRRRKQRNFWLERAQLRAFWLDTLSATTAANPEINKALVPRRPSPLLHPRPMTFPSVYRTITTQSPTLSSSSSSSVVSITVRPHSVVGNFSSNSQNTLTPSTNDSSTIIPPSPWPAVSASTALPVADARRLRYWIKNQKKRRRLIWQWSVAMGYCRYSHACRIDALIVQLEQRQQQREQGGGSISKETEIVEKH